ncbi:hypothetical protein D3C71_1563400 [compost metagenome]
MAVGLVLHPVEQALFGQQPVHEGIVRLAILDRQAAFGVAGAVPQVPAPLGRQHAAALVVGEDAFDDVEHRPVLVREAIVPLAQEGQPRLHRQAVPRHAAIGALICRAGHVAVPQAGLAPV